MLIENLLGKTIKIKKCKYGLFTEENLPVAISNYFDCDKLKDDEFYAKIIEIKPMLTI